MSALLEVAGLSKSYPGVRALDGVDLEVRAGEIHALVGENGAGKSTLIGALAGAVVPDAGEARLLGEPLGFGDPLRARRRGVSVVRQEPALVPELTAAENVFLGRELGRPLLRRRQMRQAAQGLLDEIGARVDAGAAAGELSVAQLQSVEIARALLGDSRLLVLDEPSAALGAAEVERLLGVLRRLRARGLGLVFVSHRLEEVFALADRVTVLRDGRSVASADAAQLDRPRLLRLMVGRELAPAAPRAPAAPGPVVLEASGLSRRGRFAGVSLSVRAGEIVGLAGLVGAGRSSLGLAIAGALAPDAGTLRLDGRALSFADPAQALAAGVAYLSEDRRRRGLFPELSAAANITIGGRAGRGRLGLLSPARERSAAESAARGFALRADALDRPAGTLSGGNQQKLLLARLLQAPRRLLVLDEPTRGIDVAAKAEVHALIGGLVARGLAILLISSELEELLALSDRLVVMHEGRVRGELPAGSAAEAVMALATGAA